MKISSSVRTLIAAVVAIAVIAVIVIVLTQSGGSKELTADFPRTISLYKGSDVKILGVPVGKVESVTPEGTYVRVKLSYDSKYKLPSNVKAVVISPSIVGDRFVQLTPAYDGGAVLQDNARLGVDRTATPLELDQIFGSLNDLDKALGPNGANAPGPNGQPGALTRLLDTTAANFGGQGAQLHQTILNLGKLTRTLSDNKDALFGSAAQVEKFVHSLAKNDNTVRRFSDSLANGSAMLAGERTDLSNALHNLSIALVAVRSFVHDNRKALGSNIRGLRRISDTIVHRRAQLDETLREAPTALNDLALSYDANAGTLDTRAELAQNIKAGTENPAAILCAILGTKTCPLNGLGRPAALRSVRKNVPQFDPTLAGILGGAR